MLLYIDVKEQINLGFILKYLSTVLPINQRVTFYRFG